MFQSIFIFKQMFYDKNVHSFLLFNVNYFSKYYKMNVDFHLLQHSVTLKLISVNGVKISVAMILIGQEVKEVLHRKEQDQRKIIPPAQSKV
jgi:hypothetical protein